MHASNPLVQLLLLVLTIAAIVLGLATVFIARQGMSMQLLEAAIPLAIVLGLAAGLGRLVNGRWFGWSGRRG